MVKDTYGDITTFWSVMTFFKMKAFNEVRNSYWFMMNVMTSNNSSVSALSHHSVSRVQPILWLNIDRGCSLAFINIMSRLLPQRTGDNYTSRQWAMWEELLISDVKECIWSFTWQAGPPAEGPGPFPCHDWHGGQGLRGNLMQIGWPPTCLISSGGNTNRPIWPGPSYTNTGNMFSFSPLPSSHT